MKRMIFEKKYMPVLSHECLNASVVGYLEYYGLRILPSDIFFSGGGLDYEISDEKDVPVISTDMYGSNFRFLNKYGIGYKKDKCTANDAEEFLKQCVRDEIAVSVPVRSDLLKHSRVFSQTENSTHYLNIVGQKGNDFIIADGYVPEQKADVFIGSMDSQSLLNAWRERGYAYLIIEEPPTISNDIHSDTVICRNKSLDKILGLKMDIPVFRDMVDKFKNYFDSDCTASVAENMNYRLKIYGWISSKYYLYESLAADGTDHEILRQYGEIIDRWKLNCLLLLKAGYSRKINQLERVGQKLVNDCLAEHEILKKVRR